MPKLRNRYPVGFVCVLRFRTTRESILCRLETVCIVSAFRVETSGWLDSEPSTFRVNLLIGRVLYQLETFRVKPPRWFLSAFRIENVSALSVESKDWVRGLFQSNAWCKQRYLPEEFYQITWRKSLALWCRDTPLKWALCFPCKFAALPCVSLTMYFIGCHLKLSIIL